MTSKCFEDHKPVWKSEGKADDFPWRVNIKADAVLEEDRFLDAKEIGPRMEYNTALAPRNSGLWPSRATCTYCPRTTLSYLSGR